MISLPLDLIGSGSVLAIASTFSADAAVVWVAGPLLSVLVAQPDNANAPLAATTTAKRHTFRRRV